MDGDRHCSALPGLPAGVGAQVKSTSTATYEAMNRYIERRALPQTGTPPPGRGAGPAQPSIQTEKRLDADPAGAPAPEAGGFRSPRVPCVRPEEKGGILCRIAASLAEIFSQTQEELSLRPIDVEKRTGVSRQVVAEVFKALAERGYMECVKTARGLMCAVPQDSPLRTAGREEIYSILEAL